MRAFEVEYDHIEYDTGYGSYGGSLYVEYEPILEDTSFDAYGKDGTMVTVERKSVVGIKILGGSLLLTGGGGREVMERHYHDEDELYSDFPWVEEDLMERAENESYD